MKNIKEDRPKIRTFKTRHNKQKRPIHMAKETYHMAEETYYMAKEIQ